MMITFKGKKIQVPESISGKRLKENIGIAKDRTAYLTDLDGQSKVISDGDTLYVRDGMTAGDMPRTTKG